MSLEEVVKLRESLEATLYKDLKEKFTELGISEIWKNGLNKDTLIKMALQELERIKAFEVEEAIEVPATEEEVIEEVVIEEVEAQKGVFIDEEEIAIPSEIEATKQALVDSYIDLTDAEKAQVGEVESLFGGAVSEDEIPTRPIHSRGVLKENLDLILTNLYQATPLQKTILFEKQAELMLMQDQHDACDLLDI